MERLIKKYLNKLHKQGISEPEDTIIIAYDDIPYFNSEDAKEYLETFKWLNINTLIVTRPLPLYEIIIKELIRHSGLSHSIRPADCETRTFFHDIPIIERDSIYDIVSALSRRKSAITRDGKIIAYGNISPEQAYVAVSSTCFSLFVKYLYDIIQYNSPYESTERVLSFCKEIELKDFNINIFKHNDIIDEIVNTGKTVVNLSLVDSYFGNISCCDDSKIYISQTGSSLDELEDAIDIVPLDGSSTNAITASSEFTAHRLIYEKTDYKYILHGHPKFSVIMSMRCDRTDCRGDNCYRSCNIKRIVGRTEIVSGEIGTGRWGLLHTVPQAMTRSNIVAVYGHGIFTASRSGFYNCLLDMINHENYCIKEYRRLVGSV